MDVRHGQWPHAGNHLVRHAIDLQQVGEVVETAGLALHGEQPERISRLFDQGIAEFQRVLKPGGIVCILEISRPAGRVAQRPW